MGFGPPDSYHRFMFPEAPDFDASWFEARIRTRAEPNGFQPGLGGKISMERNQGVWSNSLWYLKPERNSGVTEAD